VRGDCCKQGFAAEGRERKGAVALSDRVLCTHTHTHTHTNTHTHTLVPLHLHSKRVSQPGQLIICVCVCVCGGDVQESTKPSSTSMTHGKSHSISLSLSLSLSSLSHVCVCVFGLFLLVCGASVAQRPVRGLRWSPVVLLSGPGLKLTGDLYNERSLLGSRCGPSGEPGQENRVREVMRGTGENVVGKTNYFICFHEVFDLESDFKSRAAFFI